MPSLIVNTASPATSGDPDPGMRIASPELILLSDSLPHRKCSRSGSIGDVWNEEGEHGDTR